MNYDNYYEVYLEELSAIVPITKEEENKLLKEMAVGNSKAEGRLIEGSLHRVAEMAKEFEEKGISIQDLIQEGNLALTIAVSDYEEGDFEQYIAGKIREAFLHAEDNLLMEKRAEEEILARVNVLNKVSSMMAEELGREATVEELAEKMKMTVLEVQDIMQLALNSMNA